MKLRNEKRKNLKLLKFKAMNFHTIHKGLQRLKHSNTITVVAPIKKKPTKKVTEKKQPVIKAITKKKTTKK